MEYCKIKILTNFITLDVNIISVKEQELQKIYPQWKNFKKH